jgi:hypothetical protein
LTSLAPLSGKGLSKPPTLNGKVKSYYNELSIDVPPDYEMST